MKYRMLICDIDGTIRPLSSPFVPEETVLAIQSVQAYGVKFVISTGRSRRAVSKTMLNGLKPDYWICAAGAQVLDQEEREVAMQYVSKGDLDLLTSFFEENHYPLRFVFSDGLYTYANHEGFMAWLKKHGITALIHNGEGHTRHLEEMPFGASGILPQEGVRLFHERYPDRDIRFPLITDQHCDILFPGQSKAAGIEAVLKHCGIAEEECVSIGDNDNDVDMLQASGMSYCVEDGSDRAKAAAKKRCPPAECFGAAFVCRTLWPMAFDLQKG